MIILVYFLCFTKFEMFTRPFSDSFFAMLFVPPQTKNHVFLCQIVNLLSCYVCNFLQSHPCFHINFNFEYCPEVMFYLSRTYLYMAITLSNFV